MPDSLILRIRMPHKITCGEVVFTYSDYGKNNALAQLEGELHRIVAEEVQAALAARQLAREEDARDG